MHSGLHVEIHVLQYDRLTSYFCTLYCNVWSSYYSVCIFIGTSKDTPINYHVSTKCLSNTKVRITVQPPSENDLELITMQYSCYNGSEVKTHANF